MSGLLGSTEPRIYTPPLRELTPETTLGFAAISYAREYLNVTLYPWQEWWLIHALEIVNVEPSSAFPDGWRFRFRTVLTFVARQNGKTALSIVLVSFFLFMLRVKCVVGTSLSLDKAIETWDGVLDGIKANDDLLEEYMREDKGGGKRKLTLSGGRIYKVAAMGRRAGRGDPVDLGVLDELREHRDWLSWAAMSAATNAKPNGLLVAFSNAGDVESIVLRYLRNQALKDIGIEVDESDNYGVDADDIPDDGTVAIFEWSAPDGAAKTDESALALSNPALGYGRLTMRALMSSAKTTPDTEFRTECMCQIIEAKLEPPFPDGAWEGGVDDRSQFAKDAEVVLGIDVSRDRSRTAIAAAGLRPDRLWHVEVLAYDTGTAWAIKWLEKYVNKYGACKIALQSRGAPVSSMLDALRDVDGLEVVEWQGSDISAWTGRFFDSVCASAPGSDSDAVRVMHRKQPALDDAAMVAAIKNLGDSAAAFDRTNSPKDISTLIACAAAFGAATSSVKQPKIHQSAYADDAPLVFI